LISGASESAKKLRHSLSDTLAIPVLKISDMKVYVLV
jgi:hypothetical protein